MPTTVSFDEAVACLHTHLDLEVILCVESPTFSLETIGVLKHWTDDDPERAQWRLSQPDHAEGLRGAYSVGDTSFWVRGGRFDGDFRAEVFDVGAERHWLRLILSSDDFDEPVTVIEIGRPVEEQTR